MSSLREDLAARKAQHATQPPDACHVEVMSNDRVSFIEFRPDARTRAGFAVAQLCHYTLDANPDADGDARERLTLAFSTADVVVTGARLVLLLEPLNQHRLASLAALDARYANAGAPKPWVAKIVIARLDKSSGAAG